MDVQILLSLKKRQQYLKVENDAEEDNIRRGNLREREGTQKVISKH